jgi:hypothetical protein
MLKPLEQAIYVRHRVNFGSPFFVDAMPFDPVALSLICRYVMVRWDGDREQTHIHWIARLDDCISCEQVRPQLIPDLGISLFVARSSSTPNIVGLYLPHGGIISYISWCNWQSSACGIVLTLSIQYDSCRRRSVEARTFLT